MCGSVGSSLLNVLKRARLKPFRRFFSCRYLRNERMATSRIPSPPTLGVEKPTPSIISEKIIALLFCLNKLILKLI